MSRSAINTGHKKWRIPHGSSPCGGLLNLIGLHLQDTDLLDSCPDVILINEIRMDLNTFKIQTFKFQVLFHSFSLFPFGKDGENVCNLWINHWADTGDKWL